MNILRTICNAQTTMHRTATIRQQLNLNQLYSSSTKTMKTVERQVIADLRSDTVTAPSSKMREVMASAEVGDDVFGEDPTVNQLEKTCAQLLGKEAALFVPSGTMGNLICVGAHCRRGDQVILGDRSHIFQYEAGGASALMGVSYHTLPNQADGTLGKSITDIGAAVNYDDFHCAPTALVALENTQNLCGGVILNTSYVEQVADVCASHGIPLHIDGARFLNAAHALEEDPAHMLKNSEDFKS